MSSAMRRAEAERSDVERREIGETAEGFVAALAAQSVDCLFLNPGTDTFPIQEALAKLDALTDRERGVLMLRFGLGGQQPQTLAEIADHYGISRERVRQIEKEALAKLRKSDLIELASAA